MILGSHRNTRLKFERDGAAVASHARVPGARLAGSDYVRVWVASARGVLVVGAGAPGTPPWTVWRDPAPTPAHASGLTWVGLAAWDAAVAYRSIVVGGVPPGLAAALAAAPASTRARPLSPRAAVPRLMDLAVAAAACPAAPPGVATAALAAAAALAPALDGALPALASAAAARAPADAEAAPAALAALPADMVAGLLVDPRLAGCDEERVLGLVLLWGGRGGDADARTVCATAAAAAATTTTLPRRSLADVEALLPLVRFPLMRPASLDALAGAELAADSGVLRALLAEARAAQCAPRRGGPDPAAASAAADDAAAAAALAAGSPPVPLPPARPLLARTGARAITADASAAAPAALAAARHAPRPPPGGVELLFMADGDANGVVHWLATAGGARPYLNPHLTRALTVRASSPACRHTDAAALVSGAASSSNRAAPPVGSGSAPDSGGWWEIDLGPSAALAVDYYTLRADASGDWPRHWALQARDGGGGSEWTALRAHDGDASLGLPGQYASWPVTAPAAARPSRAFRVVATGPHAGAGRPPGALALSGVELYGRLFVAGGDR